MSKRNYILTIVDYGYKIEVWDDYGKYTSVYEKTREDASNFILDYWSKSKENKKLDELHHKAMLNMIEIDKKNFHFTDSKGNHRDGLD